MTSKLFWLSFADPGKPKGAQFLGVAVLSADSFADAISRAHALRINPGGEVQGFEIPPEGWDKIPANMRDRLLTRAEAESL